jgi:tetratricopeptide (TPR) repeat protein
MKRSTIKQVMIILLFLIQVFNLQFVQAQSTDYQVKLNAELKKADIAYKDYQFSIAADFYESYLYETTNYGEETLHKLADCYWQMRVYTEAFRVYKLLYQAYDTDASQIEKYRIAELYARFGEYDKAAEWLTGVAGYQSKAATYNSSIKLNSMKEDSLNWKINFLNINTSYREFSPFLWNNMLFFSSNKPLNVSEKAFVWDGNNFTHIWKVLVSDIKKELELTWTDSTSADQLKQNKKKLAGVYQLGDRPLNKNAFRSTIKQYYTATNRNTIGSLVGGLNKSFYNAGTIVIDKFNHVYFSANYSKYNQGVNRIGLIEGNYSPLSGISKTHFLAFGDSKTTSSMHPAVNQEGTILVFSSDKSDGKGGFDLYYTKRDNVNQPWGAVHTFAGKINTIGNEVFPSITPKGSLYFSSDALQGLGGLDIYRINLQDALNGKSEPEHLSYPVNSSADDFGFTEDITGSNGYFTSDRLNSDDNIYGFSFKEQPKIPKLILQGVVKDEVSNKPVVNATVFLLNNKENKVYIAKTDQYGVYSLPITISSDIVLKVIEKEHTDNCLSIKFNLKPNLKDSVISIRDLMLGRFKIGYKWRLGNILYDKNNFNIRSIDKPVLDSLLRLLNQHPFKIEIGVHTDSRGSSADNIQTSLHGANSAMFYLIDHGIDPDRIVSKGYGESELINKCTDGVPCTEEEHQINRRTEVKIIGFTSVAQNSQIDSDKFKVGDRISKSVFPKGFFDGCK